MRGGGIRQKLISERGAVAALYSQLRRGERVESAGRLLCVRKRDISELAVEFPDPLLMIVRHERDLHSRRFHVAEPSVKRGGRARVVVCDERVVYIAYQGADADG